MAAALGFMLGAGMNALGGYAAEKRRQKEDHDNLLFQMYATHPEAAGDPEAQKFLKKHLGPEGAELFGHISEASRKASEQFGQAFGGGAQPTSPGVQVAMTGKGGPGIAPPSQAQPSDALGAMQQRISRMETYMASPGFRELQPDQQKIATDIYNRAQSELGRMTTTQATEQGRQESMAERKQLHDDTIAVQKDFHQSMLALQQAREQDAKQQSITTAGEKISGYWTNLAKMMASQNPPDAGTLNTLVVQGNAMARQLKARAAAAGVDPDPDVTQQLTVQQVPGWWQQHTGGRVGGTTPELTPDIGTKSPDKDPLIGTSTKAPDGPHTIGGKKYIVKNGKVEAG